MPSLAILAGSILTPLETIHDSVALIEGEKITAVGPRDRIQIPAGTRTMDARQNTLVPGFVDIHIHGAGGHDVMDADSDALPAIAATLARHGTTSFVPTTVTASPEHTSAAIERIAAFLQRAAAPEETVAAEPLGIHLEGPFISPVRRGVHPPEWIAPPSLDLLERFTAGNAVRILTLAPEVSGALQLVAAARKRRIVVSLGHTDATFDQSSEAIRLGASHAAHVFNAMRPFSHRDSGVIGAVLTAPEVTAELIADGVHVDSAAMRVLLAAKGVERTILVSDGTAATGMPDGSYRLGTLAVSVAGGVCRNSEGRLAGSTLTLDRAVRTIVALGIPLNDAVRMATLNPARLLGEQRRKGVIAPGADADLVLLDENLAVRGVVCRGVPLAA
jgi:N-acetylglucosamine-6-phosphate deacetylase